MYHEKLHIVIISGDPVIEQTARSAEPFERFEHEITICGQNEELPESGDVVIFDLAAGNPSLMRHRFGAAACLVACAGRHEISAMDDCEILLLDQVWETPLEQRLTALRLRKILEDIHRDKEFRLTQIYLDAAIDTIPDMVWFKSREGLHLKVNSAFCHTVGKTREEVTGKDHCYIWDVSREEFERGEFVCRDTDEYVLRTGRSCQSDEMVKSQRGMRQFRTYKSPLIWEDGTVMGTVGVAHDVTDLKNMGAEMEIFLRSMPYGILVRSFEERIINVNFRFEKYFDVNREDVLGKRYRDWMLNAFQERTVNGEGYIEAVVRSSKRTLEIHEELIYDVFGRVVGGLSIYRDVTTERALEQKILHNSNTDFMTGLYNRRYFYQYINKNRGDQPVSLLYLDLDCFKDINDTYGHGVGDDALVRTAELLRECFKDEFIVRFGGDEFLIVILGQQDLAELKLRAERLLARLKDEFEHSEQLKLLTASIGIAQTADPAMEIDLLIQHSDAALYEAKQSGKACCAVFSLDQLEDFVADTTNL